MYEEFSDEIAPCAAASDAVKQARCEPDPGVTGRISRPPVGTLTVWHREMMAALTAPRDGRGAGATRESSASRTAARASDQPSRLASVTRRPPPTARRPPSAVRRPPPPLFPGVPAARRDGGLGWHAADYLLGAEDCPAAIHDPRAMCSLQAPAGSAQRPPI